MSSDQYFISQKFAQYIRNHNIKKDHIAKHLNLSPQHIGKILLQKRELSEGLRQRMNEYLGTNF